MKRLAPRPPSPAMIVACTALAVALGGTSYAAFKLPANSVGAKQLKKNAVSTPKIKKHAVTGAKIKLSSLGKVPSAAKADHATAADSATAATNATHATSADQATLASSLGGGFASIISERSGPLPLFATFNSSGRPLLFEVSGSAFANTAGSTLAVSVSIDGVVRGELRGYTNESGSHKAIPPTSFAVTGLASGAHTLRLDGIQNGHGTDTHTDANDFFSAWMIDLPTGLALNVDGHEPNDSMGTFAQAQPCATINGVPYFLGTIFPPGNDDWVLENCAFGSPGNVKLTVVGGPTMDVYNSLTDALLASNVTTYTGDRTIFYKVRVHSATTAAYTLLDTNPNGSPLGPGVRAVEKP